MFFESGAAQLDPGWVTPNCHNAESQGTAENQSQSRLSDRCLTSKIPYMIGDLRRAFGKRSITSPVGAQGPEKQNTVLLSMSRSKFTGHGHGSGFGECRQNFIARILAAVGNRT
jgi:hypothetical protein